MSFNIPHLSRQNALNIWNAFGDKSNCFQYYVTVEGADGQQVLAGGDDEHAHNSAFSHHFRLNPSPFKNSGGTGQAELAASFSLSLRNRDDFEALHDTFAQILEAHQSLTPYDEQGKLVRVIHNKGKNYAFITSLFANTLIDADLDDLDHLVEYHGKPSLIVSAIGMYALAGDKLIDIGCLYLHSGVKTAALIAHDLAVLKALLDGKAESEIASMRPLEISISRGASDVLRITKEPLNSATEAGVAQ